MQTSPSPHELLPLTPAVFHILMALAEGEKHGYAIMQEIATLTSGQVRMGPGTLYGTLKRMIDSHLIVESAQRTDVAINDERRRYYQITPFGERVARAEAKRLEALVHSTPMQRLLRSE